MLKTILIVLLVLLALLLGVGYYFYSTTLIRKKKHSDPSPDAGSPEMNRYAAKAKANCEVVMASPHEDWYQTSRDGLKLHALWYPAETPSRRTVVFIHGYTASCRSDGMLFAPHYHEKGYNMLLVDDRAHGESEGRYIGFGWPDRWDVIGWCKLLVQKQGEDCEIVLHGVSMGAAITMCAVGEADALPKQVRCAVEDCGYTSAWDEFSYNLKQLYHLPPVPILNFASFWCRVLGGFTFRQDSPLRQIAKAKIPVFFVHGDADTYVPTEMVHRLYPACPTEKELFLCPGATHAVSVLEGEQEYFSRLDAFLEKHLCVTA